MPALLVKTCNRCLTPKSASEFYAFRGKIKNPCKECKSKYADSRHAAVTTIHRNWVSRNRNKTRETSLEWAKKNPQKAYARSERWRKRHPEKHRIRGTRYRARKYAAAGNFTDDEWTALKTLYVNRCLRCRRSEKETGTLEADHVIPLSCGGSNFIVNIQPLCRSCNATKGTNCYDYRTNQQKGKTMKFPLSIDEITSALRLPHRDNVAANWPLIEQCMEPLGMTSENSCIAALATIRVECPSFAPQREKYNGTREEYFKRYDGNVQLGNTHPGDGLRFYGRGFVQITGRSNYENFGNKVGVNLVGDPDKALVPSVAASIFAAYWYYEGVYKAAEAGAWSHVRKIVNGGYNELKEFMEYVNNLQTELKHWKTNNPTQ